MTVPVQPSIIEIVAELIICPELSSEKLKDNSTDSSKYSESAIELGIIQENILKNRHKTNIISFFTISPNPNKGYKNLCNQSPKELFYFQKR